MSDTTEARCRHGYKLNGCELGFPGCICADEVMMEDDDGDTTEARPTPAQEASSRLSGYRSALKHAWNHPHDPDAAGRLWNEEYELLAILRELATLRQRCERLEGERDRLREALERAAEVFDCYAMIHEAKSTPAGNLKAATNRRHAADCRRALTTPEAPDEH